MTQTFADTLAETLDRVLEGEAPETALGRLGPDGPAIAPLLALGLTLQASCPEPKPAFASALPPAVAAAFDTSAAPAAPRSVRWTLPLLALAGLILLGLGGLAVAPHLPNPGQTDLPIPRDERPVAFAVQKSTPIPRRTPLAAAIEAPSTPIAVATGTPALPPARTSETTGGRILFAKMAPATDTEVPPAPHLPGGPAATATPASSLPAATGPSLEGTEVAPTATEEHAAPATASPSPPLPATIRGRVVGLHDAPIAGIPVNLEAIGDAASGQISTVTDAHGAYVLRVAPGTYLVSATHPDHGTTWHPATRHREEAVAVTVVAGEQRQDINVTLQP
jgi:hypothetical protein